MKSLYPIYTAAEVTYTAAFNNYLKNIRCPDAAAIFEAAKETRQLAFTAWIQST